MTTALITHRDCLDHLTGPGHYERPERLARILTALEPLDQLIRYDAIEASKAQLELAHPADFIDRILSNIPKDDSLAQLDPDTYASKGSGRAALLAAGSAIQAADLVMKKEVDNVFCAIRPPGHHAETIRAMGFCLFNNAAIAARHLIRHHGLQRVAILDFDVHHGNGSQEIFEKDPSVFYGSSHQAPLYPGTGYPNEKGLGNICNAPLPPVSGSKEFRFVWEKVIGQALIQFDPQFIIISAGFDAHRMDPLANLSVETEDYYWVTEYLLSIAKKHAEGRLISLLEGGYDLDALAESAKTHVEALLKN